VGERSGNSQTAHRVQCGEIAALPDQRFSYSQFQAAVCSMLERTALRANPVCCFVKLAVHFFVQSFMLPCCAIAFNDFSGTNIGMGFRGIITDTDCHSVMECATRSRARRRQRKSNDRSEIVGPASDGHKTPSVIKIFPLCKGFLLKQITKILPHFDADQWSIILITVILRGPSPRLPFVRSNGRKLITLRDAALCITKLPKAEHVAEEWQAARIFTRGTIISPQIITGFFRFYPGQYQRPAALGARWPKIIDELKIRTVHDTA
jgi:hypothetical protein